MTEINDYYQSPDEGFLAMAQGEVLMSTAWQSKMGGARAHRLARGSVLVSMAWHGLANGAVLMSMGKTSRADEQWHGHHGKRSVAHEHGLAKRRAAHQHGLAKGEIAHGLAKEWCS